MEYITSENIILTGATLLIAGIIIGRMSYRFGLPLLLVFMLVGMLFGTDGLGLQFNDMEAAQGVGMVSLCIILFSGGMGTRLSAIYPVLVPGLVLSTVGVLLTALLTGLFIWWLSGMAWTNIHFALLPSLLLASTVSSTDSASVFGILGARKVSLRDNLRPMLELESGSNDPMAYMLTILLIEAVTAGDDLTAGAILGDLALQFVVGGAMGWLTGKALVWLIGMYRRIGGRGDGEDAAQMTSMVSILILAGAFLSFALTTDLGGNGYLAVYICGIITGNADIASRRGISRFMDGMTWLAQIVVFILLGLLVNPRELLEVAPVSLLIGIFMMVVARPATVFACLAPMRGITLRDRAFVSWVGLRGAVPIIFATYPVVAGVDGAGQIFNIVFFIAILSLLVQGTTVLTAARRLHLVDDEAADEEFEGVEIADELPTTLETITVDDELLKNGDTLSAITLSSGSLVMMIRRGDRYIVPDGKRRLHPGDRLLIIREESSH